MAGPIVEDDNVYAPGGLRRWNDPNLESFGGWRVGGDNFYGDGAGDTITRGNSTLGAISGYGAARGGYGGPHFDSVGGFHNGPGPDAQEAADYASGSISRPDYGDVVPHYPSVKARVAALTGGAPVRARPARFSAPPTEPMATPVQREQPDDGIDDMLPDLGGDDF